MCSSSMTFLQFQPSDANSTEFLAALVRSSSEDDQSRSRICREYSHLDGIGMTDTDLCKETRPFRLFLWFNLALLLDVVLEYDELNCGEECDDDPSRLGMEFTD